MGALARLAIIGTLLYFGTKYVLDKSGDITGGVARASTERHLRAGLQ
jgi:hypothetical protein